MVTLSLEIRVLNLNQLENNIAGSALHPLVTHVCISKIRMTCWARLDFQSELFNTRNNFLWVTKVALPTNHFTLSLTSRTNLSIHIVISSSQFDSPCDSSLTIAFMACHNIVWIFSTSSFTMWACHLFFYQYIKLFPKIEVLKLQKDLYFQFWTFELVEIKLVIDIRIVHFFNTHTVIQILFILIVKSLISCVKITIPTLIFSNLSLEPGFLSGWYFFESLRNASLISSWLALTGNSI